MVRITRYPHRIRASVVSALVLATVTLAASGLPADAADTATSDGQAAAPVRGAIHGYVFDGERYRTIDFPGATRTEAWDITNRGDVIGLYANATAGSTASAWTSAASTRSSTTRMGT